MIMFPLVLATLSAAVLFGWAVLSVRRFVRSQVQRLVAYVVTAWLEAKDAEFTNAQHPPVR